MALVDKPEGPTSHHCVARVRRVLGVRRIGHLGTLDPFASGLLVLLVGSATRLARLAARWTKTYEGTVQLGTVTDTGDVTGAPTATSDAWRALGAADVAAALRALEGPGSQHPPAYSAKKVAGERAHRRARRGETVSLPAIPVVVHRFTLVGWQPPDARFTATVSSGTYLRSLARSVGERLGCGAHLAELRRTVVGPYRLSDAVSAESVRLAKLGPLEPLAAGWPRRDLDPREWAAVAHGRPVADSGAEGGVTLFTDGVLVGIAEVAGGHLRPRVVLPRE